MKCEKECVYLYCLNNEFMDLFNFVENFFEEIQYTIQVWSELIYDLL